MRSKKALINVISNFANEIVSVICGLILPRLIMTTFGSSYNGITSSITQFLSCASLLVAGVGGVTKAALYKPLADNSAYQISAIINATRKFMQKVALILALGITVFASLYPFFVKNEFEWLFSFTLVLILGISTFLQYYFCVTYQLLLQADQKQYIIAIIHICSTIANTIIAIVLIKNGFGIHVVKLGSAVAFSFIPLLTTIYVNKKYQLEKNVEPNTSALKQRWDGFWQAIAHFVHNNTDIILLTLFTNLKEVSVYTVYNYVVSNIRTVIVNSITGFGAAFGNMLAKKEYDLAKENLKIFELIVFSLVSIVYSTAAIMIVPFALLYTKNVEDVNYSRPLFAFILVVAGAFSCFRIPYQTIVEAAGHFKKTRNGAIVEAILNISISLLFVYRFGLIGVAIGTLVATVFRSIQYACYLSKNVLKRSIFKFVLHVCIAFLVSIITFYANKFLFDNNVTSMGQWVLASIRVVIISLIITISFDVIFYKEELIVLIKKFKRTIK